MLKAVIFDQDGVLIDSEKLQFKVWTDLLLKYNVKIKKKIWKQKYQGRTTMTVLQDLFKDKFNKKKLIEIQDEKDKLFMDKFKTDFKAVDGVSNFIKKLYENKIKIGVATSSNNNKVNFTLKKLGILKYIDVIVTSEDTNKTKPDPEIYLITAARLRVKPKECLVFEDAILGVEAARQAGMKAILVKTSLQENELEEGRVLFSISKFNKLSQKKIIRFFK